MEYLFQNPMKFLKIASSIGILEDFFKHEVQSLRKKYLSLFWFMVFLYFSSIEFEVSKQILCFFNPYVLEIMCSNRVPNLCYIIN